MVNKKKVFKSFIYNVVLRNLRSAMKYQYDMLYYHGYEPEVLLNKYDYQEINNNKYIISKTTFIKSHEYTTIRKNQTNITYDVIDDMVLPTHIIDCMENMNDINITYDFDAGIIHIELTSNSYDTDFDGEIYNKKYDVCADEQSITVYNITTPEHKYVSMDCKFDDRYNITDIHVNDCELIIAGYHFNMDVFFTYDDDNNIIYELWFDRRMQRIIDQCNRFYEDNSINSANEIRYYGKTYIITDSKYEYNFIDIDDYKDKITSAYMTDVYEGEKMYSMAEYFYDFKPQILEMILYDVKNRCYDSENIHIIDEFFEKYQIIKK